jgi:hypothetical protein
MHLFPFALRGDETRVNYVQNCFFPKTNERTNERTKGSSRRRRRRRRRQSKPAPFACKVEEMDRDGQAAGGRAGRERVAHL